MGTRERVQGAKDGPCLHGGLGGDFVDAEACQAVKPPQICSRGSRNRRVKSGSANDPGFLSPAGAALLVDLYELTMSASYLARGITEEATFELFPRRLPPRRDWLLAAGLGPTLELLRELRFGERELDYLRSLGLFDEEFLDYLGGFRFTGDVEAIPEGTVTFANEPLLRVTA